MWMNLIAVGSIAHIRIQKIIERLLQLHPKSIDLSLNRIKRLLKDLNNPESKLINSIQVVGTNGKHSFCTTLKEIFETGGYKVNLNTGKIIDLQNPTTLPDPSLIRSIEEPWIKATIITPDEYLGSIIKLCQDKRGIQNNLSYSANRAVLNYELPLNEVVFDFNDRIKSMTSGYASFDYEILEH